MTARAWLVLCALSTMSSACVKEATTLEEAGFGAPVGIRMVLDEGQAYEIMLAISKEEAPEKHIEGIASLVHQALKSCPKFLNEGAKKAPRKIQFDIKAGKVAKSQALAPNKPSKACMVKALDGKAVSSAQARSFMVMAELRGRKLLQ